MTRRILLLAATLLSGALLAQPIGSYYCGSLSEQWGQPSDVRGGGGTRLLHGALTQGALQVKHLFELGATLTTDPKAPNCQRL